MICSSLLYIQMSNLIVFIPMPKFGWWISYGYSLDFIHVPIWWYLNVVCLISAAFACVAHAVSRILLSQTLPKVTFRGFFFSLGEIRFCGSHLPPFSLLCCNWLSRFLVPFYMNCSLKYIQTLLDVSSDQLALRLVWIAVLECIKVHAHTTWKQQFNIVVAIQTVHKLDSIQLSCWLWLITIKCMLDECCWLSIDDSMRLRYRFHLQNWKM